MKKIPLRSVVFPTFLIVVFAAISHGDLRAQSAAGPTTKMDLHMSMTKLHPPRPGDQARADAILAAAKKAAERYRDSRKAEADGYTIFMPEQRQNVYHFILESTNSDDKDRFDPDQPRGLLYTKIDESTAGYKLIGVMYMAPYGATEQELNARIPLSFAMASAPYDVCPAAARTRQLAHG